MKRLRKARSHSGRFMLLMTLFGVSAGSLFLVPADDMTGALRHWLLAEPELMEQRLMAMFFFIGLMVVAPLLAMSCYCWRIGVRVSEDREFPPADCSLLRHTEVVTGTQAVRKGKILKILALGLVLIAPALTGVLWRLAALFTADIRVGF